MPMNPRMRRAASRLGLVLLGLLLGLVLAEGLARVVRPHGAADILFNAPGNAPDGLYVTDRALLHRPNPGFEGTIRSLGYAVPLRVNSHGLRGAEPGPKASPRWIALGDSFTFAAQVREEQTFEALLAAQAGLEVLNGGADAWSTWQAPRLYKRLDAALGLDGAVVVLFLGNDLHDNERFGLEEQRHASRPEGNPLVASYVPGWLRVLHRNSYLLGQWRMRQRLATYSRPDDPERNRWRGEVSLFSQQGALELSGKLEATERALRELQAVLRAAGDPVLVAVAPPAFAVDPARLEATFGLLGLDLAQADPGAPARAVVKLLEGLGLPACDLGPALAAAVAEGEQPYFQYDGHWTPDGHAVVAARLAECLQAVPPGPPPAPPPGTLSPRPTVGPPSGGAPPGGPPPGPPVEGAPPGGGPPGPPPAGPRP